MPISDFEKYVALYSVNSVSGFDSLLLFHESYFPSSTIYLTVLLGSEIDKTIDLLIVLYYL